MPAWNATEALIIAFDSFYDVHYMVNWYKRLDIVQELTDDNCVTPSEFEEYFSQLLRSQGPQF